MRNDAAPFLFAMLDRKMRLVVGAGYHDEWDRSALRRSAVDRVTQFQVRQGEWWRSGRHTKDDTTDRDEHYGMACRD